ncbi:toxic anion resistance protein, partial [Salinicoccus roseus]|nr:toxic anion resistance protein [Salinicoccus roseus]
MKEENKLKEKLLSDPFSSVDEDTDLMPQPEMGIEEKSEQSTLATYQERFTEEDLKRIEEIKNKIEPLDNDALIQYGSNAQQALSKFSHQML